MQLDKNKSDTIVKRLKKLCFKLKKPDYLQLIAFIIRFFILITIFCYDGNNQENRAFHVSKRPEENVVSNKLLAYD